MPRRPGRQDDDGGTRREFLRAAMAVGGLSGLSACVAIEGTPEAPRAEQGDDTDSTTTTAGGSGPRPVVESAASEVPPTVEGFPSGPEDLAELPDSLHRWGPYLSNSRFGNTQLPRHQLVVMFDYVGDALGGPGTERPAGADPDPEALERERQSLEDALATLDRAFKRGTGGNPSEVTSSGLLYTVGYSPSYFDRFPEDLPADLDLQRPETVLEKLDEDATADGYDLAVHLGSGWASVVLGAEAALLGDLASLNGVEVAGTFEGVFERAERRAGFAGSGLPSEFYDVDDVADAAPLSMGFKSGFANNLPPEPSITLESGPFAGGTLAQLSRLTIDLERWYDSFDHEERVKRMFSPDHSEDEVGAHGENLSSSNQGTLPSVDNIEDHAAEQGLLGHGQKTARARNEQGQAVVLRRDFDGIGEPSLIFHGWSRRIEAFVETRKAMNGEEFADEVDAEDSGIKDFLDVTNRATFLIPPRDRRAMPSPRPEGR